MGAGASALPRLRKALVIRSYNLRAPDETIEEQFRVYAFRDARNVLHIKLSDIKLCLGMDSGEYMWVEDLFQHTFGAQVAEINFSDFIRFLENGKPPSLDTGAPTPSRGSKRQQPQTQVPDSPNRLDPLRLSENKSSSKGSVPPFPPAGLLPRNNNVVDAAAISITSAAGVEEEGEEGVMHINLSNPGLLLPSSLKLRTNADLFAPRLLGEEEHYSLILHPSSSKRNLVEADTKPLWRKREVVRQERSTFYTTIDANGEQQELVEKETTQSEVLHMECKETGEFAHRETTMFEQLETFNEEVVSEVQGQEEYVHLKSLEDEFHYMESTMPKKEAEEEGEA
ncbi:hypothetical protein B484DRAFT_394164, partial [Ochromonadaceae sp. CCMP2298]